MLAQEIIHIMLHLKGKSYCYAIKVDLAQTYDRIGSILIYSVNFNLV